jgi:hypothetical protein
MTASSGGFKVYLMRYVVACYDMASLSSFGLANDTNKVLFTFRRVLMGQQDKSTTKINNNTKFHHLPSSPLDNAGYAAAALFCACPSVVVTVLLDSARCPVDIAVCWRPV